MFCTHCGRSAADQFRAPNKPKFREYLLRSNQPVNYKFEGVEYSITIEEVAIFPQGYAAS